MKFAVSFFNTLFFVGPLLLPAQSGALAIPFSPKTILVDGASDDWDTGNTITFNEDTAAAPFANVAQINLAWDEDNFYLLARVRDQHLVKLKHGEGNASLFLNDAVELYLDTRANSHGRMDLDDYQWIVDVGGETVLFKGDKHRIQDSTENYVPKEAGIANILYRAKALAIGSLGNNADRDSGYVIELAVPWAAIGLSPHEHLPLRLDICLDDADEILDLAPLREEDKIPHYQMITWSGERDFGFPATWRDARLVGKPGFFKKLTREHADALLLGGLALALLLALAVPILWLQFKRIQALKNLPARTDLGAATLQQVSETPAESQRPKMDLPAGEASPLPSRNRELVARARLWVLEKLGDNVSPEQLAQALAVSLRNLQRIFREELKLTPGQFILMLKLEKAAEMLRTGQFTVSEVAYDTGFSSPAYFSSVFKKYFDVSPSEVLTKKNAL